MTQMKYFILRYKYHSKQDYLEINPFQIDFLNGDNTLILSNSEKPEEFSDFINNYLKDLRNKNIDFEINEDVVVD
jgi:chloramphenicol O-acetyltransferase